jgi:predicted ATPase
LARKQGALAWELRTAMNLGKLWAAQSRESDALDLLEPLYGRFTEGLETADLIAARRLIDELRSPASSRPSSLRQPPLSWTLPEQA